MPRMGLYHGQRLSGNFAVCHLRGRYPHKHTVISRAENGWIDNLTITTITRHAKDHCGNHNYPIVVTSPGNPYPICIQHISCLS